MTTSTASAARRLTTVVSVLLSIALLGVLNARSSGQAAPDSPASPAPATADTFTIDSTHSMGLFRVQHFGAGVFWGRFNTVTGTIVHDDGGETPLKLDVAMDINSIDVGNERLDGHLKSEDFFFASEYPEATFKSTSSRKVRDHVYEVAGDLTIRGITKQITVNVEWMGTSETRGKRAGFETVFTVNRHDFGVSYGPSALGEQVRLTMAMEGVVPRERPEGQRRGDGDRANREPGALPPFMARMDANGDGKLQKDEMPERMRPRFDQMDTNGDGALDGEEIQAMRRRGGRQRGEGRDRP